MNFRPKSWPRYGRCPASLDEALASLENDYEFLLRGGVFTDDLIETWLDYKKGDLDNIRLSALIRTSSSCTSTPSSNLSSKLTRPEPVNRIDRGQAPWIARNPRACRTRGVVVPASQTCAKRPLRESWL